MTSRSSMHLLRNALYCFLLGSLVLLFAPLIASAQPGTFSATGVMVTGRSGAIATLLANGEVLVVGGQDISGNVLTSAELYDPATATFAATGSMITGRYDGFAATLLANGKVLVTGGVDSASDAIASAELYDPTTGSFSATGTMTTGRYQFTATLLSNGQVLLAGGCYTTGGNPCQLLGSAEIYDPTAGTFTATGSLISARASHSATLLPNGQVLVAGGTDFNTNVSLATAELFDPANGAFGTTGSMITGRTLHSAALLPNGQVLVATGYSSVTRSYLVSAELYNSSTATFSATGSMTTGRVYQSGALLASGEFLIAGGGGNAGLLASAELYNPATANFTVSGPLITARDSNSLTLLPSGKLLAAGGDGETGALASAELYSLTPPLTFSPTKLTFSKLALGGTSSSKKVTITNKTGLALTLVSWVSTGTNAGDFTVTGSTCGGVLNNGASCSINVGFAPQQAGARSASLHISDSASNSPQSVALTGTAILPVSVSPTSLKFANTKVGTTSAAKIVTITNSLPATLSISGIAPAGTNAGDFAVQTTTCGATLGAGSKCSVVVAFTPTGTGSRVATLSISDAAVTSPQTVALSGTGK